MALYNGRDFLLQVDSGGGYATVGGMRTTALSLNSKPVDVSTKTSGAWRALMAGAGLRSVTVSAGGVFENSASEEAARAAAFAGTALNCRLLFGEGDSIIGTFIISNYERSGEHDGEESWSITLESAGTITFTGA